MISTLGVAATVTTLALVPVNQSIADPTEAPSSTLAGAPAVSLPGLRQFVMFTSAGEQLGQQVTFRTAGATKTKVVKLRAMADLNARKTPSLSGKTAKVNAYRKGQYVPIVCQTKGGKAYGSTIWNKTTAGTYVVDAYLYTGTNGYYAGLPKCTKKTTPPTTNPPTTNPPTSGTKNFTATVALDGRTSKKVNGTRTKTYKAGATLHIKCQAYGAYAYGSPIWDKTTDNLWVPDHYVKTGVDGFVKNLARCDNDPKPTNVPLPVNLNATQTANAKLIIAVGKGYHLPKRGWEIAIATAMQESQLYNLSGGDRDSVGLFQQRPSTGWGSVAQCTTKKLAIRAFYGIANHTHNPGLTDIRGWQQMSLTRAAQAVQRSGYPNAYAKWEPLAKAFVAKYADQISATR